MSMKKTRISKARPQIRETRRGVETAEAAAGGMCSGRCTAYMLPPANASCDTASARRSYVIHDHAGGDYAHCPSSAAVTLCNPRTPTAHDRTGSLNPYSSNLIFRNRLARQTAYFRQRLIPVRLNRSLGIADARAQRVDVRKVVGVRLHAMPRQPRVSTPPSPLRAALARADRRSRHHPSSAANSRISSANGTLKWRILRSSGSTYKNRKHDQSYPQTRQ